MNILVIGGGGREHALVWKLAQSPRVKALFASPGSDAMAPLARCVPLDLGQGGKDVISFAQREQIDLVVVGPEGPLVEGLADRLTEAGVRVFGPSAAAARLEGSKAFSKDFMARHGIPTAGYRTFDQPQAALDWLAANPGPRVVKADGLAAGKGVSVCHTPAEAAQAVRAMMVDKAFGQAGARVVLEDLLVGQEASYFVICDGRDFVALPPCQDHKAVNDHDQGPNTGGMGAYCPAPVITAAVEHKIQQQIVAPTLAGMAAEGHPYRGCLFVGLMISPQGEPRVIEYNCRFGDPECQPLMMMLDVDLAELLDQAATGKLGERLAGVQADRPEHGRVPAGTGIPIRAGSAACVVMASQGYPGPFAKGLAIHGLENLADQPDRVVFHAGTRRAQPNNNAEEGWQTQGGRVLGVTARGDTLAQALDKAYAAVKEIHWEGAHYRTDIGKKAL
ncbi:MAG: phosphoribosylamine--glycine ligase [Deltaproteobacteria bacterium]|nr:phosphoribosylamine--glycine ligase [Deltaproteobacteria bacterium]